MRAISTFLLTLLLSTSVLAESSDLVLNGTGTRKATIFGIKVYNASLYLSETSSDAKQILASSSPKRLTLEFVRDLSNDKISETWREGVRKNATNYDDYEKQVEEISRYFGEIKEGDIYEFTFNAGSVTVQKQGHDPIVLKGPEIEKVFLSIWLGPDPADSNLKKNLLGVKE